MELFRQVERWGWDRKIIQNSTVKDQYLKLVSEIGELGDAIAKCDDAEIVDAIGDSIVVLTMMAAIHGHSADQCLKDAYMVIKDRKGYLNENGVFIKEEK